MKRVTYILFGWFYRFDAWNLTLIFVMNQFDKVSYQKVQSISLCMLKGKSEPIVSSDYLPFLWLLLIFFDSHLFSLIHSLCLFLSRSFFLCLFCAFVDLKLSALFIHTFFRNLRYDYELVAQSYNLIYNFKNNLT